MCPTFSIELYRFKCSTRCVYPLCSVLQQADGFFCCPSSPLTYLQHPCLLPGNAQRNAEGSSANELVLRLFGVAKTRVMYDTTNMTHNNSNAQSYTHREMLTEKKEFLSYDVQLANFGGTAASGSHSFPFSVMLPPGLPPSMEVRLD